MRLLGRLRSPIYGLDRAWNYLGLFWNSSAVSCFSPVSQSWCFLDCRVDWYRRLLVYRASVTVRSHFCFLLAVHFRMYSPKEIFFRGEEGTAFLQFFPYLSLTFLRSVWMIQVCCFFRYNRRDCSIVHMHLMMNLDGLKLFDIHIEWKVQGITLLQKEPFMDEPTINPHLVGQARIPRVLLVANC